MIDSLTAHLKNKKIILASQSPRRQTLLKEIVPEFEIRLKEVDESYSDDLKHKEVPQYIAKVKAEAHKNELSENEILITSDTIVSLGDTILEKPKNEKEAFEMIKSISENTHTVYTGVCITSTEKQVTFVEKTKVYFRALTNDEINYYIKKYQPFDKAGSYGIQEWIGYIGIEKIKGCFFNVMGLPLQALYSTLIKF